MVGRLKPVGARAIGLEAIAWFVATLVQLAQRIAQAIAQVIAASPAPGARHELLRPIGALGALAMRAARAPHASSRDW